MLEQPNFHSQLALGLKEENIFLKRLRLLYPHAIKIEGSFKEFDFYIPDIDTKVELKTDRMSNDTGNFVIETFHYGKPSGITTTTADFWIFFDGFSYYWIDPDIIKNLILTSGLEQRRFIGNGDTVEKRAYLMPKVWITDQATRWDAEEQGKA